MVRLLVVLLSWAVLAWNVALPAEAQQTTIRLAHHLPTETEQHEAALTFARLLEEKTGGRVKVNILPGAQLGGQREIVEGVSFGTIEMGFGESGIYANYVPKFNVIALPFLYRDHSHWASVVDGPIGGALAEELRTTANLRILNWMLSGYRDTYLRDRAVQTPEDLRGVRIRLPEAPVFVETFRAFGAIPTPIPAPEMYTALQTGVVDAMEGTPEVGYTYRIYEVTRHLSRTRHILMDGSFVINESFFARQPADIQQAILEAAREAQEIQRAQHIQREAQWFQRLQDEGQLAINDVDIAAFAEVVRPMYEKVARESGALGLLAEILGE